MKKVKMSREGRLMEYEGSVRRTYWSTAMLDILRRMYPMTRNEELAGILGVNLRVMQRKARELGLVKDPDWLRAIHVDSARMGHAKCRSLGYPWSWKKMGRENPTSNPVKKGSVRSEEERMKISEGCRRFWRSHPTFARECSRKSVESRRRNNELKNQYYGKD